jgi:hypothetical protein
MGRKKTARGKKGKKVKQTAPVAASSKPARARNLDHLKNKKLHGLEFGLTQRNNILMDCYAADRVPREVILDCFEKAGIYPPEASFSLLDKQSSTRSSRRISKVEAGKELKRIANDPILSTDEKLIQCSQVCEDVMELSKYEQASAEDLCFRTRGKNKKKKSDDSDDTASPSRPAFNNVVGNFSPRVLLAVSNSFAREREEWNKVRLFLCNVEGCTSGLRGTASRFSAEGYLRSHMQLKHGVTLQPMDAAVVRELKRRQKTAEVSPIAAAAEVSPIAAAAEESPIAAAAEESPIAAADDLGFGGVMHRCMMVDANGEPCDREYSDAFEMSQHYWSVHPQHFFNGFKVRNCETGVISGHDADAPKPFENWAEWYPIVQRWLGPYLDCISRSDISDVCRFIQDDADNNGGEPDYKRVESAMFEACMYPPRYERGVNVAGDESDAVDVVTNVNAGDDDLEPAAKRRMRTCSLCRQPGHDKRNCPTLSALSPIAASPHISPIASPMSPSHLQSPPHFSSPETATAPSPVALVAIPSKQKSCSMQ